MALGGGCVPNDGKWEVGPTTVDLTDLGKEFFGVETLVSIMYRVNVTRQINNPLEHPTNAQRPCPNRPTNFPPTGLHVGFLEPRHGPILARRPS